MLASQEEGFDVGRAAQQLVPCWYRHPGKEKRCTGVGHLLRHHVGALTEEAKKENEANKKKYQDAKGKGKGRGRGRKGGYGGAVLELYS